METCQEGSDTSISQVDGRDVLNPDKVRSSFMLVARGIIWYLGFLMESLLCETHLGFSCWIWRVHRCSEHLLIESTDYCPFLAGLAADPRGVMACILLHGHMQPLLPEPKEVKDIF